MSISRAFVAVGLTAGLAAAGCERADSNAAGAENIVTEAPDAGPYQDFARRIQEYLAVRAAADLAVPTLKETADPAKISDREKLLGDAIAAARPHAKQGDIFTPATASEFARLVREDFAQRSSADRTAVLEEVPTDIAPRINAVYPTTAPLATVPPTLLLKLPTLPPELEYRFVARHLILRDIRANLIIDYIPNIVHV